MDVFLLFGKIWGVFGMCLGHFVVFRADLILPQAVRAGAVGCVDLEVVWPASLTVCSSLPPKKGMAKKQKELSFQKSSFPLSWAFSPL